jgi:thioredoxin-related protein
MSALLLLLTAQALGQQKKYFALSLRQIQVRDVNGKKVRPLADTKPKATVLLFTAQDCPISNRFAPEVIAICKAYMPRQIAFYIVYVETENNLKQARKHATEFGYPCPAVVDPKHLLSRALNAKVTPEAVVVSPEGKTLYQGRIDDRYVDFGKMRPQPKVRDLRLALDAVLAGKPVPTPRTTAIGCYIPEP